MGNVADAPRLLLTVTVAGFVSLSWLGSTRAEMGTASGRSCMAG